jgi:hypothetical protein
LNLELASSIVCGLSYGIQSGIRNIQCMVTTR